MQFTDYDELYEKIVMVTDCPEVSEKFNAQQEAAKAMHIVAIFDMEIQNGGLCQFFSNGGSPYATKVIGSLQFLGLEPMALLYKSFIEDHRIDPTDLTSFHCDKVEDFAALCAKYPYDEFDDAYMGLWESLNFSQAMLRFANAHPEALI